MVLRKQNTLVEGGRNLSECCQPKTESRDYTNHFDDKSQIKLLINSKIVI